MSDPPSVQEGEITAKGSLNINNVLIHRSELLEWFYADGEGDVAAAIIKL